MLPEPTALTSHHLEACVALDQRCLGGLWSASQWGTELADPRRPGLGLWRAGQLCGVACSWLIIDELHITLIAVDPQQRHQGIGRRLLHSLLTHGRQLGAERATLEVGNGNTAALALYQSLGFVTAGIRRNYYRDGQDALIQWRQLQKADPDPPAEPGAPSEPGASTSSG